MIVVTAISGSRHRLAPAAIADIEEPAPSSAWHGIHAIVRLFDGRVIEARETPEAIQSALMEQMR